MALLLPTKCQGDACARRALQSDGHPTQHCDDWKSDFNPPALQGVTLGHGSSYQGRHMCTRILGQLLTLPVGVILIRVMALLAPVSQFFFFVNPCLDVHNKFSKRLRAPQNLCSVCCHS